MHVFSSISVIWFRVRGFDNICTFAGTGRKKKCLVCSSKCAKFIIRPCELIWLLMVMLRRIQMTILEWKDFTLNRQMITIKCCSWLFSISGLAIRNRTTGTFQDWAWCLESFDLNLPHRQFEVIMQPKHWVTRLNFLNLQVWRAVQTLR